MKEREFNPLEGPYTLDGVGVLLYQLLNVNKDILEILREDSSIDGTTVSNLFTLPVGSQVMKIDFVEALHKNIPAGVNINVPLKPVQTLIVDNKGPGNVYISTNKPLNQLEAASIILNGETRNFALKKRAIKFLNIVPEAGKSSTIRLEVLV